MTRAAALAALVLAGCTQASDLPADESAVLDPVAFFTGLTRGDATLDKLFSAPVPVAVASIGKADRNGRLVLDQVIREGTGPPRRRQWVMVGTRSGQLTGSLTDAAGPVDIRLNGPRADIAYRMKNGMLVEQQLALQDDGKTLLNRLTVSRMGIELARLDEKIRKLD